MGTKVFASARAYTSVTPSDSTAVSCKALWIGTGGNLAIAPHTSGSATTFVSVPGGSFFPVELQSGRVMSTNTTASNIIAVNW
jgi:hypothetical protein